MNIDVLSNCAPVLRADPYSLDNDALAESIEASRAAGFDAVGLWGFHVMFGGDDAARVVTESGMPVQTIDAALGWVTGASDEAAAEIDGLIALADQLGAGVIHATTLNPEVDLAAAAEGYAQIAARAEAADKVLGLEFLPWTGIPTLAVANQLCENAGPAAGILLDTWHWVRQPGGPDLELLRSLPAHRITSVQLSDVAASTELEPEPEAMTARLLPGDGVVNYAELWEGTRPHRRHTGRRRRSDGLALVAEGASSMAAKVTTPVGRCSLANGESDDVAHVVGRAGVASLVHLAPGELVGTDQSLIDSRLEPGSESEVLEVGSVHTDRTATSWHRHPDQLAQRLGWQMPMGERAGRGDRRIGVVRDAHPDRQICLDQLPIDPLHCRLFEHLGRDVDAIDLAHSRSWSATPTTPFRTRRRASDPQSARDDEGVGDVQVVSIRLGGDERLLIA